MAKSPDAFRTISEVAEWLGVETHVLRFWESKFSQIKPTKRAGGRRYYRPNDMELLGGIKRLLHEEGLTIKGAQKVLREEGVGHVASLSKALDDFADTAPEPVIEAAPEPEKAPEADTVTTHHEPEQLSLIDDIAFAPAPQPEESPAPSAAPAMPKDIGMPKITPDADIPVQPGVLSAMTKLQGLTTSQAKEMRPLLTRLTALRDAMRAEQGASAS